MAFSHIPCLSLDGILSVGKSHLCDSILQYKIPNIKFAVVNEPVDLFTKMHLENGKYFDILKAFYKHPFKYAFTLQLHIIKCIEITYNSLLKNIKKNPVDLIIFDRSLDSVCVFIDLLYNRGYLNKAEKTILENEKNEVHLKFFGLRVYCTNAICFLTTPMDICNKRFIERGRASEMCFTDKFDQYQTELSRSYSKFLLQYEAIMGRELILKLDYSEKSAINEFINFASRIVQNKKSLLQNSPEIVQNHPEIIPLEIKTPRHCLPNTTSPHKLCVIL
jgi:deoxyadenosine/deoxycytidine kinase